MKTIQEIKDFFQEIQEPLQFAITDYIYSDEDYEKINQEEAFDSIYEILSENNAFDIEIIYYSEAIKYLAENDPSLRDSLDLAGDLGYEPKNINSELLASLHASDKAGEEFSELSEKINEFFGEE